jgi:hypothetical protein
MMIDNNNAIVMNTVLSEHPASRINNEYIVMINAAC